MKKINKTKSHADLSKLNNEMVFIPASKETINAQAVLTLKKGYNNFTKGHLKGAWNYYRQSFDLHNSLWQTYAAIGEFFIRKNQFNDALGFLIYASREKDLAEFGSKLDALIAIAFLGDSASYNNTNYLINLSNKYPSDVRFHLAVSLKLIEIWDIEAGMVWQDKLKNWEDKMPNDELMKIIRVVKDLTNSPDFTFIIKKCIATEKSLIQEWKRALGKNIFKDAVNELQITKDQTKWGWQIIK